MSLLHIPFDSLQTSDLQELITNGVREGRYLDYKEALIGRTPSDHKEFLKDVVSFANSDGGDLIYGIRERRDGGKPTGIPDQVVGLPGANLDAEINRLEGIIRNGVGRRLSGVRMRAFGDPPCLVVRVLRSWDGPHMVTSGESRFYSRHSAGRLPLDIEQIRQAFLGGETRREQLRLFRADRIGKVIALDTPVVTTEGPKFIFHAMPLRDGDLFSRIMAIPESARLKSLRPPGNYSDWNPHHNIDGFVAWPVTYRGGFTPYVQLFRNGALEAVGKLYTKEDPLQFSGTDVERDCIELLVAWRELWALAEEPGPMILALTITGVRGYLVRPDQVGMGGFGVAPIATDVLVIPDVLVEDVSKEVDVLLKDTFDMLWQAGGRSGSPYYRPDGRNALAVGRPP